MRLRKTETRLTNKLYIIIFHFTIHYYVKIVIPEQAYFIIFNKL